MQGSEKVGMRPQGEIRSTIFSTLRVTGPLTQRDLAERAQVGYDATRYCVQNAVRAGVLQIVGREKRAHCDKWVALYDVPREQQRGPKLAASI
jgi:hypothetical protein